jgi:hypothetical protein
MPTRSSTTHHNGCRERDLETRLGALKLKITGPSFIRQTPSNG